MKRSHLGIVSFTDLHIKQPEDLVHFAKLCNRYVTMTRVSDTGCDCECANEQTCWTAAVWLTWNVPRAFCRFIYLLALLICVKFRAALLGLFQADTGDCLLSMSCPACRKHQPSELIKEKQIPRKSHFYLFICLLLKEFDDMMIFCYFKQ